MWQFFEKGVNSIFFPLPCPHRDCFVAFGSSQRHEEGVMVSEAWCHCERSAAISLAPGIVKEGIPSRLEKSPAEIASAG